jgi:hypothetical protein
MYVTTALAPIALLFVTSASIVIVGNRTQQIMIAQIILGG